MKVGLVGRGGEDYAVIEEKAPSAVEVSYGNMQYFADEQVQTRVRG